MRTVLSLACTVLLGGLPYAQSIGLVTDTTTNRAILFDADSYQSLGSVAMPVPVSGCEGDCVINSDRTLAYVSGFTSCIFVVDLTTQPPTAAGGTNPIPISSASGRRMDITPDGQFLVISGNYIVTVDLATRTEVSSLDPIAFTSGVDASSPGSVLITQPNALALRRLIIASDGTLTDSGEQINVLESFHVVLEPGGQSGVCASRSNPPLLRSFRTPSLTLVDSRTMTEGAISLMLTPDSKRVYARTFTGLEAYTFDASTAHVGNEALFRVLLPFEECFVVRPVFHPDGTRLFMLTREQVLVLDIHDGHQLGRITDPAIVSPRGISLRAGPEAF